MTTNVHDELLRIPLDGAESIVARVTCREGAARGRLLVLFPPHPSLAGEAENNVIRALAEAGVKSGRLVLRLHYRRTEPDDAGGGRSLAFWDDLDARQDYGLIGSDCLHIMETVRQEFRTAGPIEIAAYSFGVYVALAVLGHLGPARLVGISPPLTAHDFSGLAAMARGSGQVAFIGSAGDPFCPPDALQRLAEAAGGRWQVFESGDHFYRGEEHRLATAALEALQD